MTKNVFDPYCCPICHDKLTKRFPILNLKPFLENFREMARKKGENPFESLTPDQVQKADLWVCEKHEHFIGIVFLFTQDGSGSIIVVR